MKKIAKTHSLFVENSDKSLGIQNPESADEVNTVNKNTNILGIQNPASADEVNTVNKNKNILGIQNPESADEVITVKNRINKNRSKCKNSSPPSLSYPTNNS